MLNVFAMKSAIKERSHSKYHHQMVFHITVPSNILIGMTRMPLGTLDIKFRDSEMFILRNRLNGLHGDPTDMRESTSVFQIRMINWSKLDKWQESVNRFVWNLTVSGYIFNFFL